MEEDAKIQKITHEKIVNYLFNPQNVDGWPKGQWFIKALGFDPQKPEHLKILEKQIRFDRTKALFRGMTRFGEKYDLFLPIAGPNGKTIDGVKPVWLKDHELHIIRLVTILPPKKKS